MQFLCQAKFLCWSYSSKCCKTIKLQDSLINNNCRTSGSIIKIWYSSFFFFFFFIWEDLRRFNQLAISMRGLSFFSSTGFCYSYGCLDRLYVEGTHFWTWHFLKNSGGSYSYFWSTLLHYFISYWSPWFSLCTVNYIILSNINKALSACPSANVFVFGDSKAHHKD